MKPAIAVSLVAVLALAAAACQGEKKPAQAGSAAGEILPGSASDAMLPYDTVRSQPPLAPAATGSGRPGGAARGPAAAPSDAAGAPAGAAPAGTEARGSATDTAE